MKSESKIGGDEFKGTQGYGKCQRKTSGMEKGEPTYHRCHKKTSYVSNYAFFILLHKWVDRGKHITLKNSNNTLLAMKSELHTEEFL